jgi:uncharacterized protein
MRRVSDVRIAIMARAPEPGRAKTRLIPRLGALGAAQLHAALVTHALRAIKATGLPAALWCAPDISHPFFARCAQEFGIVLRTQSDGDLGARMARIFEDAGAPLLLMGSDCPSIDAAMLLRCAKALDGGAQTVFLPAEDGGYGLVGLRAPIPEIFADMPWGTDAVMAETRRRLAMLGVVAEEPATVWDVDRPEDVDRLEATGFPIPAAKD